MPASIQLHASVPADMGGMRFDQIAAELFSDYSRARLQAWIKDGSLRVDGKQHKAKDRLYVGQQLSLEAELQEDTRWQAEDIELDIVYEDESILVINKPAGLVVHPGAGNMDGTLLNALLHHAPEAALVPRAGIVHRLDKDTTGLMVVAKTVAAQTSLVEQLQARTVKREYEAVIDGEIISGGTVDAPIGRHLTQRTKMAVLDFGGKPSVTHYRVLRRFPGYTHVRCLLETGRTHQIRVHMSHIKHPLVGDSLYGFRVKPPKDDDGTLLAALRGFPRQALHARRLGLIHPASGEPMGWDVPLPDDFLVLLDALEYYESRLLEGF